MPKSGMASPASWLCWNAENQGRPNTKASKWMPLCCVLPTCRKSRPIKRGGRPPLVESQAPCPMIPTSLCSSLSMPSWQGSFFVTPCDRRNTSRFNGQLKVVKRKASRQDPTAKKIKSNKINLLLKFRILCLNTLPQSRTHYVRDIAHASRLISPMHASLRQVRPDSHHGLLVILQANTLDQLQLGFQPINMLLLTFQDAFKELT